MRKLWEDHITWTRLAIVSFAGELPDFDQTAARLLRNQEDIGNAIKPYYGRRAGNRLTALLKQHIGGAVELLQAAKAGDDARFAAAKEAWYRNGRQISRFLSNANPRFLPFTAADSSSSSGASESTNASTSERRSSRSLVFSPIDGILP